MTYKPFFCPSLMCLDFLNPAPQLEVVSARADVCHLDIMDGHFCPNISLTPGQVKAYRQNVSIPMEAHLMVDDPAHWLEVFADIGCEEITLHREAVDRNAFRLLRRIAELGRKAGIALCPATPVEHAEHLLDSIGLLTIMTVDVGYSGQAFIPQMLDKVERARELRERHGYRYAIQVDGGAGPDTFAALKRAGADRFVLGSALFSGGNISEGFDRMYAAYEKATGERLT